MSMKMYIGFSCDNILSKQTSQHFASTDIKEVIPGISSHSFQQWSTSPSKKANDMEFHAMSYMEPEWQSIKTSTWNENFPLNIVIIICKQTMLSTITMQVCCKMHYEAKIMSFSLKELRLIINFSNLWSKPKYVIRFNSRLALLQITRPRSSCLSEMNERFMSSWCEVNLVAVNTSYFYTLVVCTYNKLQCTSTFERNPLISWIISSTDIIPIFIIIFKSKYFWYLCYT